MTQNGLHQLCCKSAGTETDLSTSCVVRGAHGMKKFLQNRLAKIRQILSKDHPVQSNEVYLAEFDEKHPDKWEKIDGWPYVKWIRHHEKPRRDLFVPAGGPSGPSVESSLF